MIGFSGSVFSNKEIAATFSGDNTNKPATTGTRQLSRTAIIGISVGVCGLLIVVLANLYLISQRRRLKHVKGLNSKFDERFGAPNITSPNAGAFGNPYASPAAHAAPIQYVAGGHSRNGSYDQGFSKRKGSWQGQNLQLHPTVMSPPQCRMPTHQAYVPKSPAESHSTQFSMSPYPSARNSPEYPAHLKSHKTGSAARTPPLPVSTHRSNPQPPPRIYTRNYRLGDTLTSPFEERRSSQMERQREISMYFIRNAHVLSIQ